MTLDAVPMSPSLMTLARARIPRSVDRGWAVPIVLHVFGLLSAPAFAQDPARERLDRARAFAAQGKHEDALAALRAAVALHRGDVEISREYQNALARLGRREEAVKEYRALVEAFPDEATWRYLYGRLLDGEAFEREMARALELAPTFFWAHFGLGQYRLDHGRAREAIPRLLSARELRPDCLDAHDLLAKAHYVLGEYEQAENAWREAAKRFPDSPLPHLGLGVMAKTVGQADASKLPMAIRELSAVVEKWPEAWEAYEPLVQSCYAAGDADKAERYREKAREAGKRNGKKDMLVDVVDLGNRVMLVREVLDPKAASLKGEWLSVSTAEKGPKGVAESAGVLVVRDASGGVTLFRGAEGPGRAPLQDATVATWHPGERFDRAPSHADLIARLRATLGK